ncbi:DUF3108 domain-containing protein [Paraburkholderia megapolitana]|uniref:DUF3108 domain-containing protein n=1 Tax=Paraburkholderia megapolitana TaxID=420953 RepID=UPI0038BA6A0A
MSSSALRRGPNRPPRPNRPPVAAARSSTRAGRWIAVLIAVLCLHWIAAEWIERNRQTFQPADAAHAPVEIALLQPERIEQKPAAEPAAAAPKPAPVQRARPHASQEHVLTATQPDAKTPVAASAPAVPEAASAATATAASGANGDATATGAATPNATSAAQATPGVKFSVPPSSDMQYDTFYNGVRNQPGTIHWTSDSQHYEIVVSMPVPFVGPFTYSSHGRVDAFGLAPDQYIEKRGRRPEDVTIFNRTDKQIAFTRTPTTLALPDGAQDRFSMVMQLASLVRGDPDAYKPGVTRQFYVADNNSGEIWPIETIGDETVRTAQGFVGARHFMRLSRHAGDERRIDVWLAPSLGWLPVRLVQTEPNGTQIELVWRGKLGAPDGDAAGGAASPAPDVGGASGANDPAAPKPGGATGSAGSAATPASSSIVAPATSPAGLPAVPPVASPAPPTTASPDASPSTPPVASPAPAPASNVPSGNSAPSP